MLTPETSETGDYSEGGAMYRTSEEIRMAKHKRRMSLRKGWLQAVLRRVGLGRRADVKMGKGPTPEAPRRTATQPTCRMRRRVNRMEVE